MTDRELLDRIAEKDAKAFDVLYNRYERLFYRWVFSRLNDYDAACDVTQIFWIGVWTLPTGIQVNEHGSAKDYLLRNLTFRILKQVQKEASKMEISNENLLGQQVDHLTYTHISEDLYVKEILHLMDEILRNLPPLTRKIYELRHVEHRSVKETAEALSISEKTVRNGLSSALSTLRQELNLMYETGHSDKLKVLIPLLIYLLKK
ncbi:MAG: polymerase sigma factor [Bacteroidetes bacterium]|jgi:RNA polymerase sigma factor (sigma-70 family)|nr:polymerase sigma factor [Bacteroidota bacterium]